MFDYNTCNIFRQKNMLIYFIKNMTMYDMFHIIHSYVRLEKPNVIQFLMGFNVRPIYCQICLIYIYLKWLYALI